MPAGIRIIEQGDIVAASLSDYLQRHPRMESRLTRGGTVEYLTTENPEKIQRPGSIVHAKRGKRQPTIKNTECQ